MISLFVTLGFLFSNISEMRRAKRLPDPAPALPDEEVRRLRGRPIAFRPAAWIGLLAVVGAIAGILIYYSGATQPGGLLNNTILQDDFSNTGSGWRSANDQHATEGYLDGMYRILVKQPPGYEAKAFGGVQGRSVGSVSVAADVEQTPGTGEGLVGLECVARKSPFSAYAFTIDPSTDQFVLLREFGTASTIIAWEANRNLTIREGGQVNHLSADCTGALSGEPARLTFFINGHQALQYRDSDGFPSFDALGLIAITLQGGTEGRFDNAVMNRISSTPPPAPPGVPILSAPTHPPPAAGRVIIHDDFSNPASGYWDVATRPAYAIGYVDGTYRVDVKRSGLDQLSWDWVGARRPAVAVEVDARKAAASTPEGRFGVVCVGDGRSGGGYLFLIDPDFGDYEIDRISSTGNIVTLTQGPNSAVLGGDAVNDIRGDCVGGGGGATTLTLYVNNLRIAHSQDVTSGQRFSSFQGTGMYAFSNNGGTDIRFDNIAMSKL